MAKSRALFGVAAIVWVSVALGAEQPSSNVPRGVDGDWWSEVRQRIAASEYEISWQERTVLPDLEQSWHAPNRSQNLRTYFTREGIRVVQRDEAQPSWEWALSLIGYGRGETVAPVSAARLLPAGNRMDYERGAIVEWYINDERGLKQGFTLAMPPEKIVTDPDMKETPVCARAVHPGEEEAVPAFVVLGLGGTLSPMVGPDGQAIDFVTPSGAKVLHYAKLLVTDARGDELDAWMEGFAENGTRGLRIVYDDGSAIYPVTIDPLATSPTWTAEADQSNAWFGYSVSTAGDVDGDGYDDVIVGAYQYDNGQNDEGRAFVYHGSPSGPAVVAAWTAESDQAVARFGISVSTAGDVNGDGYGDVIVGANIFDNGETNEGRAYVYHGSPSGLSVVEDWTGESDQAAGGYGISVSTAGDVNGDGYGDVIVGASTFDNGETDEGRAYVYHGSSSGLSAVEDWTAEPNQASARFGISVSTAGDVNGDGYADVIVGAYLHDNGEGDEGRVYVYHGSSSGLNAVEDWTAESDQVNARIGVSVSTAGDVNGDGYGDVIVGAHIYDNGESDEGRAYVYHGSSSGLSAVEDWTAEPNQASARFGISVSTAGDVNGDGYADVIVGAYLHDNGEGDEGRVYVYHGSSSGLNAVEDWTAESDQVNARIGVSVSTAGDVNGDGFSDVIVGAYLYDNGESDEGRAFLYDGSSAGLATSAAWIADSDQAQAQFGVSVSTAGDVNGDGYADVIVGANRYDNGESDEGRAFVYHGSSSGLAVQAAWTAESDQIAANFGDSVSTAGDVNGDGYADVIIGAQWYDGGETDEGRAYVYHGSSSGLSALAAWTVESNYGGVRFGKSVSSAGDVNGDGYADVIVGAHQFTNGQTEEGRAFVYHGSSAGLATSAAWTAEGDQDFSDFGWSVSSAGDVNGDGYADVIIGAYSYDNVEMDEGRAYVYHGSSSGLALSAAWTAESDQVGAGFGGAVSTAGDVNGDGYADVIVGAEFYDTVATDAGRAHVYHGSSSGLASAAAWTTESDQTDARFGGSVSTAGDVNGDGYADVIVGADRYDEAIGKENAGRAYVYHGSSSGLSTVESWSGSSDPQFWAFFGSSVSTAGDVNGDGYADVIVGARAFDNGVSDEGGAFVYYGNEGAGLSLRPQQRRPDDLGLIAPAGRSLEPGSFRLAATGRTPFGRGKVKLEWEVKPLGSVFDGLGAGQSAWFDVGTSGAAINELISSLEPGPKHWRMRFVYDPVTTPLQSAGRWFTTASNGWEEKDLLIGSFVGGLVWRDQNGDGIMQPDEPRLSGVDVDLLDGAGAMIDATVSSADGSYRFEIDPEQSVRLRFLIPAGWRLTLRDRGVDDLLDSDADRVTGETVLITAPFDYLDEQRWSAGLRRSGICTPPDETVYIYSITTTTDGNDYPILNFQDPNQPGDVTGYNIYRSSDAGLPREQWPLVADNVVDMDESEPNKQWTDTSGDTSPSGSWFYQVAAYNDDCPTDTAEGPW